MNQKIKFLLLFIVLFIAAEYFNEFNKNRLINRELSSVLNQLKTNFDIVNETDKLDAESINAFISNDEKVLTLLSQAVNVNEAKKNLLRQELYKYLDRQYREIRKRGILQVQFVLSNNVSFLRLHKPDKYGDDLTGVRYTFEYVNKMHKPISGFEQGRVVHGFRNVFPLFQEGKYICAYEISFSSESVQSTLTKVNKLYTHFLVNRHVFDAKRYKRSESSLQYKTSIESDNYMLLQMESVQPRYLKYLQKNIIQKHKAYIEKHMNRCESFSLYQQLGKSVKVVSFLPIKDVKSKKTAAYLVSYTDNYNITSILYNSKLITGVLFIGLFLLVYLFYLQFISKKVLKETAQEQQKLLELFDKGDIALFRWRNDINWSVEYVSNNVSSLTGYFKKEFLSGKIEYSDLIDEEDLKNALHELAEAFEKNLDILKHKPYQIFTKNKTKKWVEQTTLFIRDKEGDVTHFLGYLIDISKRKKLEIELQKLNENLKQEIDKRTNEILQKDKMLQEQAKLAAMGEMVGAIAHQWRQPLNSLNINIQNLDDDYEEGLIDEQFIDDFIAKQTQTINFMSKTIDDFRNFFRVDKIKHEFSIKQSIENTLSLVNAQLTSHNIQTSLQGEDFMLNGVGSEFQQVILNIISNAKDAIVQNHREYGKIDIELKEKQIIISDNAGGIPQDIISRIFEPYFTTKEQGMGTGVGLYMSKIIIEQNMGGRLHVSNTKEGAEFIIDFKKSV
ncbi:ATP-binding protein [Sulfurimonas autotrophica]|uniref:histidine kinase n=1 Tax=Sulfurimonas autotrophica (strain ATCC BAA-671 / DSM 16294 / JCM 11897 / OK10) TaxID=563040 RepID=E0UQP4_SULAO|nr:ATP-binding protein [Sulfurimonas autotrophica]ADN09916.1 multi-sensor signal transduction histidine kinase [Sulfurimonas autotrophica DSM 16294]